MTEPLLYVCDLDGTLLRSDGSLSGFARDGLNRLLDAGIQLTVASSRGTDAMRALLAGVRLQLPVIEFNGAFVSEFESGRHLVGNVLPQPVALDAIELLSAAGAEPVLSTWDGTRDRVRFGSRTNEGTAWYIDEKRAYDDPRLTLTDDLLAAARTEQIAAITAFIPDAHEPALTRMLRSLIAGGGMLYSARNCYCPGWTEVQVQHSAAEKGAALQSLLAACGIPKADVVACGDHLNDLGLFAAATRSIAPANAHSSILEIATQVVDSNDEDGVIRYLLDHHGMLYI